jgi:diaminopimelate decarboxylase
MNTEALRTVAATYGTPTYIFDVREVEARIRLLRSLLPEDTGLCFAVKANPFLIPYVADMVDRLEVCSPGEYEICIQEQIAPEKIVVSGVNKTYESMKRILSYSKGAGIYTIE